LPEPALEIDDLPPLDFVMLSHHHGDHFDDVAAARLPHVCADHQPATRGRKAAFQCRPDVA
jgi:L-ascorbate metabolism protein UlaG (beta-lactamase superfamily)